MIARAVNHAADLIHRAQENGTVTAAGLAIALDSAQMLMSPEMAHRMAEVEAERDALQARVDEVERKYTFDGQRLIRAEQRRAELEAVLETHRKDDQAEIERLRKRVAELESERHATNEALAGTTVAQPRAEASADRLTRLLAPSQALCEGKAGEVPPLTVFRAEYEPGIPLNTYTNLPAAQKHCETVVRREYPDDTELSFVWAPDDEDEPTFWELTTRRAGSDVGSLTDYSVSVVDVASAYDEEADE